MNSVHCYVFSISGSKPLLCYWNDILSRMHVLFSATSQPGLFQIDETSCWREKQFHWFGLKTKDKHTLGTLSRYLLEKCLQISNALFPDDCSLNGLLPFVPSWALDQCHFRLPDIVRLNYTNASKNVFCYNDSASKSRCLHENICRAGCRISGWLIFIMKRESNFAWNNGFTGRGKWNVKVSFLLLQCMLYFAKLLL